MVSTCWAPTDLISPHSYETLTLSVRGAQYQWNFIIANITLPLIGADLLAHFYSLADIDHQHSVDANSCSSTPLSLTHFNLALHISMPICGTSMLSQHRPLLTNTSLTCPSLTSNSTSVHPRRPLPTPHIVPGSLLSRTLPNNSSCQVWYLSPHQGDRAPRFRHLTREGLAGTKQAMGEVEEMGLSQKASSPCGDYRRMDMQKEPNHHPFPNIADVTSYFHKAKVFSMINLLKGYYQVPMNPEDIPRLPSAPLVVHTPSLTPVLTFEMLGPLFNASWMAS
ncbi:uncharacterized protein [Palaemon carinicauda]|uniref:uncharacterized protein n=1 Tax=Palaemon carinicauda TaxID=392227 RepID=UPI0035B6AB9C